MPSLVKALFNVLPADSDDFLNTQFDFITADASFDQIPQIIFQLYHFIFDGLIFNENQRPPLGFVKGLKGFLRDSFADFDLSGYCPKRLGKLFVSGSSFIPKLPSIRLVVTRLDQFVFLINWSLHLFTSVQPWWLLQLDCYWSM